MAWFLFVDESGHDRRASPYEVCAQFGSRAFASIVGTDARPTAGGGLRKDYAYLFERFFYFLEDRAADEQGIVVFDELEKSKSHLLIDQMHRYFEETAVGRHRASRIISWGFRMPRMTKPAREELAPFADQIARLRYLAVRERLGNPEFEIWSFARITDLRTQAERDDSL